MKKVFGLCLILWAADGLSADDQSGASSAASDDERALIAVGKMTAWKLNPEAITQGCEKADPQRGAELRAAHEQWTAANRDTLEEIDVAVGKVLSRLGSSTDSDPMKANDARALTRLRQSFENADAGQRTKVCANLADFLAGLSQELKPMLAEALADVDKWLKSQANYQEQVISVPGEGWRIRFDVSRTNSRASERRQRSSRSAMRLALGSRAHSHRPIALSVCVARVTSGWPRRIYSMLSPRPRRMCCGWSHGSRKSHVGSPVSSTAVLKAAKTRISTPVCHLVVIAARVGRDSPALPACRASRCVRRRRAD